MSNVCRSPSVGDVDKLCKTRNLLKRNIKHTKLTISKLDLLVLQGDR
jgi:hypothetical protein